MRIPLTSTAAAMAFLLGLSLLSYHLPFSLLFSKLHSYDDLFKMVEESNKERARTEERYFSSLNAESSKKFYQQRLQKKELQVAIGIISTSRKRKFKDKESFGYLYPSAAALDRMVKNYQLQNDSAVVFICNVDLNPQQHRDAMHIAQFMPHIERYGENSMGIQHSLLLPNSTKSFRDVKKHRTVYVKETYDYVFCLNVGAALKPQYIMLVEEDTVPCKEFPAVFNYLLRQRLKANHNYDQAFAFIKFYFPAKWQGFSLQVIEILDLLSISTLGAIIYCLISHYFSRFKWHEEDWTHVRKNFIKGFLLSIVSCYIIGRQNINELRRLSPALYRYRQAEKCCTQAQLYPLSVVPALSRSLMDGVYFTSTDLLIGDFVFLNKLPSYQVEPNVFHHTGLHSTLLNNQKHPEEFIFHE